MKRALRRELRARRARVRDALRARRAELRAARARARRPRRRWRWALLLALLLLLLLRECSCEEPPPPLAPRAPAPPPAPEEVVEAEPPLAPPPPVKGRVRTRPRPALEPPKPPPKRWLDDFRLQVAARSLRLSACFEGADRPGAVRWTCALDPRTGAVSDQRFEPIGGAELGSAQRRCLRAALADPAYRLEPGEGAATPDRVSLVLEF